MFCVNNMETQSTIPSLEVRHYQVNSVKNPYTKEDYFQLYSGGTEVGYIDKSGIHLICYHSKCATGVFIDIEAWKDRTPLEMSRLIVKHWDAIYDRFSLKVKFDR